MLDELEVTAYTVSAIVANSNLRAIVEELRIPVEVVHLKVEVAVAGELVNRWKTVEPPNPKLACNIPVLDNSRSVQVVLEAEVGLMSVHETPPSLLLNKPLPPVA